MRGYCLSVQMYVSGNISFRYMVFLLDDNSEIGLHVVWSEIDNLFKAFV